MRMMNKYEEVVADCVHHEMRKHDDWPYYDSKQYMDSLQQQEPLTGKNMVCVWIRDGKAITKECDVATELVDVPQDCKTIFRHQIEEAFYDATRPFVEL